MPVSLPVMHCASKRAMLLCCCTAVLTTYDAVPAASCGAHPDLLLRLDPVVA